MYNIFNIYNALIDLINNKTNIMTTNMYTNILYYIYI